MLKRNRSFYIYALRVTLLLDNSIRGKVAVWNTDLRFRKFTMNVGGIPTLRKNHARAAAKKQSGLRHVYFRC